MRDPAQGFSRLRGPPLRWAMEPISKIYFFAVFLLVGCSRSGFGSAGPKSSSRPLTAGWFEATTSPA
jgi:hypothetical protein